MTDRNEHEHPGTYSPPMDYLHLLDCDEAAGFLTVQSL